MKKWLDNHKEIIVFLIYSCVTFSLLFFHENWRDEAQAWLIARDCSIPELIAEMKYEGHFLLWYLILMPFAKLGFPYFTINVISWFITCISVWLLFYKAPFRFFEKLLIAFSFPLLYLYPVISRCYCLIPLAVVLMAVFYKDRLGKPLRFLSSVVLLFNSHIIMAGMVGVVLAEYLIELFANLKYLNVQQKKDNLYSVGIMSILMIASICPLFGCLNTNKEVNSYGFMNLDFFQVFFVYPLETLNTIYVLINKNLLIHNFMLAILAVLLVYEVLNKPQMCLKIWVCVVWQCLICAYVKSSISLQRAAAVIFIILFFEWIYRVWYTNKLVHSIISFKSLEKFCVDAMLIINIMCGLAYIIYGEIPYYFSNANEMAMYINNNLNDNSVILSGPRVEFISGIIPYTKRQIKYYHIQGKRYFSYAIWDEDNKRDLTVEDLKKTIADLDKKQKLYYIYCSGLDGYNSFYKTKSTIKELVEQGYLKELYSTCAQSIAKESYAIYKVCLQ